MKRPPPRFFVIYHLIMMCIWALALIPTLLWWKNSILWIGFMSLYANWVGHFSAFDASRAECRMEREDD